MATFKTISAKVAGEIRKVGRWIKEMVKKEKQEEREQRVIHVGPPTDFHHGAMTIEIDNDGQAYFVPATREELLLMQRLSRIGDLSADPEVARLLAREGRLSYVE